VTESITWTDSPAILGITLAVIARDEAAGIGRALLSARSLVEEAVVLVDDATTDDTERIAREHGARTDRYTWRDDFSAARNEALALVRTPWTLTLDGHEHLDPEVDAARVVGDAFRSHPEAAAFMVSVRMENGECHRSTRLHRTRGARWSNAVHNVLHVPGPTLQLPELVIVHDRQGGQTGESRRRRSIQRERHVVETLSARIDADPLDTRSVFYLAQQHRDAGRWEQAYYWYRRYDRIEGGRQWNEERFQAAVQAGRAALALRDPDAAAACAVRATEIMDARAEGWALLGDAHYARGSWRAALDAYETASRCEVPQSALLWVDRSLHEGGWRILDHLSMCCWHLGLHERGADLCRRILDCDDLPGDQRDRVVTNMTWHESRVQR
jgi:glycosyltransferase involved in cell wall biosynthesis